LVGDIRGVDGGLAGVPPLLLDKLVKLGY